MKNKILESIKTFTELEHNWDGYGAVPLLDQIYLNGVLIINELNILPEDYFPNPHGTLSLEYEINDGILFIEIGLTGLTYSFKDQSEDSIPINGETIEKLKSIINLISFSY